MYRANVRLLPLIALMGVMACDEEILSLSEGQPSTLAVRVYVDADGNGAYDAGTDVPVSGATVTASSDGGDETATTEADGLASFASLPPASYSLALAATPPAGAVLSSALNPTVVAPFQGDTLTAEFRYAFFPGDLQGTVYRDENGNGTFDAGTDVPAPGIELTIVAEGDDTLQSVTDADGAYSFAGLRPGPQTIAIAPFVGLSFVDGLNQDVTISADAATTYDIEFTGSLDPTDLSAARALTAGDTVVVEGTVTWQQEWDASVYFLQDATGGISTFDTNDPTLSRGDQVRVQGVLAAFRGEVQLSPVLSIAITGNTTVPAPRSVTADEVNAGQFQGELVSLSGTVDSVQVFSFDNHMVFLTDDALNTVTAYVDSRNGIASSDWTPGDNLTVVGVLGTDDRNDLPYRIELRDPDDIVTTITVADARTRAGEDVTVDAVITWQQEWDPSVYFLQDSTGGISTFDTNDPTLSRGDSVRIRGTVGSFRGEVQLSPVPSIVIGGNGPVPTPRSVTASEVNAGQFQGELVRLAGVVDSLQVFSFDNHMVFMTDAAGNTVTAYVDSRNGMASTDWTTSSEVLVTGVLGSDDRNTLQYRIEPRDVNDMLVLTMPSTIAAARGQPAGTSVTVEGVITWQQEWDPSVYFLQDATGGISTFDTNDPTLRRGDRVRITGDVGAFRGETQLSPVSSIAVIGQEAVPTPRAVTATEVNAGLFQGELVTLSGTLDSIQVFSFDNHMLFITEGGTTVTAYVDSRNGIASSDWTTGVSVTVIGVLGSDDRNTLQYRVELRDANDMVVGSAPMSIASARGQASGTTVTIEGVITWQQEWDPSVYFLQDASGGISTFDTNDPTLSRGDRVRLTGDVGAFRSETQVSPVSSIEVLRQDPVPTPRAVTGAEVNAGQFQGELVTLTGTVDSLQVFSFDNHMVFLTDGAGTVVTAYVDSRNGIASGDWTTGVMATVIGVLGTDDRNTLLHRIELRDPNDRQ